MPRLPDIPSIGTAEASVGVRRVFDAIRRAFSEINKSGGVETGSSVIDRIEQAVNSTTSGSSSTHTPPKPVNVVATGGFAYITVSWDDPQFAYLAHAEVWRSTGTVISDATRVGTTNATMFSDLPPSQSISASYHYWVRFVSNDGTPQYGPWSDMVTASTADDPAYVLEVLAGEIEADWFAIRNTSGTDVKYPFVVDATYGVVMDSALIKDGTITNAKIASLAVDKLYAASGTMASVIIGTSHITNAMIANAAVTNAKIGDYICSTNFGGSTSDPYTTPGTAGWCISKSGGAAFNNVKVRGDIEATSIKTDVLNVVQTHHIADEAVTTVVTSQNTASISTSASGNGTVIATATVVVQSGYKVILLGQGNISSSDTNVGYSRLIRGSTVLTSQILPTIMVVGSQYGNLVERTRGPFSIIWVDAPTAGTYTYNFCVDLESSANNRVLIAMVVKK